MLHCHLRGIDSNKHRLIKSVENADIAEYDSKAALVLGGGAPNSALMAGALAAFEDHDVQFDVVSASGAGALVGLLWLAPKGKTPAQALRDWLDAYVDDTIYNMFPVAYKVFFKPGPMAENYREWTENVPPLPGLADVDRQNPLLRMWRDWTQLITAAWSPSSLAWGDGGLCARVPWADKLIDFDRIKDIKPHFYLNAYNISQEMLDDFSKEDISLEHFKAAFAFPLIYGPYHLNGSDYYEAMNSNFDDILEKHPGLETIVVFDVLGSHSLIRKPTNLYDAWVLSIIIPLVKLSKANIELFALKYNDGWRRSMGAKSDILVMPFDLADEDFDKILDWSHSNGKRLFEVGYQSAEAFLKEHPNLLPARKQIDNERAMELIDSP